MRSLRLWKLLFASMLVFLVAACKPLASFVVTPTPVLVGQTATFDASGSSAAPKPRGNELVSFEWKFGDGQTGSGEVVNHVYGQPGVYTVTLTVKDTAGRTNSISDSVTVESGPGETDLVELQVIVRGADGALLRGATVSVGNQLLVTDAAGVAKNTSLPKGASQVLRVSKEGFIAQTVNVDINREEDVNQLGVYLLPLAQTIQIEQAELPQILVSNAVGASVTLPEEALVTATGGVATGPISMRLTPWNVMAEDALATLGQARTAENALMVSAGAMSVEFFDASGRTLQLGAGKSAEIQMNLVSAAFNGTALSEGSRTDLFHFDENSGVWSTEGLGEVVAAPTSPTGLALRATVSHFSTWSWGSVYDAGSGNAVSVRCVDTQGSPVRCSLAATAVRSDGSFGNWYAWFSIGLNPPNVRLPTDLPVQWQAQTADGLVGSLVTEANADISEVNVVVDTPSASSVVSCLLPDASAVACSATLTSTRADGSAFSKNYFVPLQGAVIQTELPPNATLLWTATAFRSQGGTALLNSGSTTSGASGSVNIVLGPDESLVTRTARVRCDPDTNTAYGNAATLDHCQLQIVVRNRTEGIDYSYMVQAEPNVYVNVTIPQGGSAVIQARGTILNPTDQFSNPYDELSLTFDALATQTLFTLQLMTTVI